MDLGISSRDKRPGWSALPRVRPTTQVLLQCRYPGADNRSRARRLILEWAHEKWPTLINEEHFDKPSFEFSQPGVSIEFVSNSDQSIWAFRVEHLDLEAARTWTTEMVVAAADGIDMVGVRNYCAYLALAATPTPSSPRVLRSLAKDCHLLDAGREISEFKHISTSAECEDLVALLCSEDRTLPVIVLSARQQKGTYPLQPVGLIKQLSGLAHIYLLDQESSTTFGLLVSGRYMVFDGAVRTFYPGFSMDSNPFDHPVAPPSRIEAWEHNFDAELKGVAAFQRFLIDSMHFFSVKRVAQLESCPSYQSIKRKIGLATGAQSSEEDPGKRLEELRAENETLHELLKDDSDARVWRNLAESLDLENDELRQQLNSERSLNQVLSTELDRWRVGAGPVSDSGPTEYQEIPDWIARNYSAKVRLHSRAIRSLKSATYRDIELVCRAIEFLAEEFHQTKTSGGKELLKRRDDKLNELGLELSPSLADHRLGEFRDQYTVDYQSGQSTKHVLDMHLKTKGNSKDPRNCLRIYFFWDPQNEVVVIGHLPSHLDNRLT
jgi:hypothetical protein